MDYVTPPFLFKFDLYLWDYAWMVEDNIFSSYCKTRQVALVKIFFEHSQDLHPKSHRFHPPASIPFYEQAVSILHIKE
jgi:hypothetical protein